MIMSTMTAQTTQVYAVFIRATPEQVWDAITKPEFTSKYFYGSVVDSTWEVGSPYAGWSGDRTQQYVDGEVLESDPPRRLQHTWRSLYDENTAVEPHSRVTWEIEPQEGGVTKLTVVHDQLEEAPQTAANVAGGWSYVLSGLKTLLETGEPLQQQ
jgi:uncharacterized protein YndB with AHSA1/START domain